MGGDMVGDIVVVIATWLVDRFVGWSMGVSLSLWRGKHQGGFRPGRIVWLLLLGVAEDVIGVRRLGLSSALWVSLMVITWLVARQYQKRQLWWWYGLGLVGEVMVGLLFGGGVKVGRLVGQLGFLWLIQWWSQRFGRREAIYVST
jgi:hypothetical protein